MAGAPEKSLVLVSLVILCCLSASGQTDQLLPEIDTYFKLSSDVRVSFQAKETREGGDPVQAEIGPSLDFCLKPLVRLEKATQFDLDDSKGRPVVFSVGYRFLPNANNVPETQLIWKRSSPLGLDYNSSKGLLLSRDRVVLQFSAPNRRSWGGFP